MDLETSYLFHAIVYGVFYTKMSRGCGKVAGWKNMRFFSQMALGFYLALIRLLEREGVSLLKVRMEVLTSECFGE